MRRLDDTDVQLAHVIRYTVLSQNFHFNFRCFKAMAYIRL